MWPNKVLHKTNQRLLHFDENTHFLTNIFRGKSIYLYIYIHHTICVSNPFIHLSAFLYLEKWNFPSTFSFLTFLAFLAFFLFFLEEFFLLTSLQPSSSNSCKGSSWNTEWSELLRVSYFFSSYLNRLSFDDYFMLIIIKTQNCQWSNLSKLSNSSHWYKGSNQ